MVFLTTVYFENSQDFFKVREESVHAFCDFVLSCLEKPQVEIGVYFVGQDRICDLHEEHMEDPTLTDCITFPIETDDPQGYLGDVFICPYAAKVYLEELGPTVDSSSTTSAKELHNAQKVYQMEVSRYLVHTLLHLCGYRDETAQQQRAMRQKEDELLEMLQKEDLLLQA